MITPRRTQTNRCKDFARWVLDDVVLTVGEGDGEMGKGVYEVERGDGGECSGCGVECEMNADT